MLNTSKPDEELSGAIVRSCSPKTPPRELEQPRGSLQVLMVKHVSGHRGGPRRADCSVSLFVHGHLLGQGEKFFLQSSHAYTQTQSTYERKEHKM